MQNTHSPYTPTTEEVRAAFRKGSRIDWNSRRGRLFDRWLNEVKAQAWEEGCRWGAVEFQTLDGKLYDEDKVQVTDADNPYRQEEEQ